MGFRSVVWDGFRHARDFDERRSQGIGLTADTSAKIVGGIFARAADRHLHDHGSKRRQDEHEQRTEDAKAAIVVPPPAEKHAELRKHGDSAGNGSGNGHSQRVVIADVAEFVTEITPATSSRLSVLRSPVVAQTAACCGFRPVAKALGCALSIK